MTSPELTGGTGFTFEDAVAARYLAAMLSGVSAAGLGPREVRRVAQQQAAFGEPLDDVIVDAVNLADSSMMRLSLQANRSLRVTSAVSNNDFREVIQRSWQTLQKPDFREHVDRVGAAVGTISDDAFRDFTTVCEWARASDSATHFSQRFAETGNASAAHRAAVESVRDLLSEGEDGRLSDEHLHRLLSHLVLIKFDFLHEGSVHEAEVVTELQRSVVASQVGRAGDLWQRLRQLARDGAGRSADWTRASVLRHLGGDFRFSGSPALAGDLQVLREASRQWLDQQASDIGGVHIDRPALRGKLTVEIGTHRLTLIKGMPGTGKTVLLRDVLAECAAEGPTLLLTANRLTGRSWAEYARSIGLSTTSIESLLVEISATGQPILFVDGVDRIIPEQRPVLTDVLGQILSNPSLDQWRIVATARDVGIEPLRNWMPASLLAAGGVGYVDAKNLTDEEAAALGQTLPLLRPLLMGGNPHVRELGRRPFFAAVLARGLSATAYSAEFAPQSEVDLVEAWWVRGGYDAQTPQALARQRALIELAQSSASELGRNVRIRDLTPATQGVLSALVEDGLVQQVRAGHTVQFSHDIFFEWSFYHLLLDQGDEWLAVLQRAGEPPALARVVELLSQATYRDFGQWGRGLTALEEATVRPQWLRAWLMAPVFSPAFHEQSNAYTSKLFANEHQLLAKLLVWMQAEKTIPNPLVLCGQMGAEDLASAERIRLADLLGWPSDLASWQRLLLWALDRMEEFPAHCFPDLVALFGTWQLVGSNVRNPVSERIVRCCSDWLVAIENERESWRGWRRAAEQAEEDARLQVPADVETDLRGLLLRAARTYPDIVGTYLGNIEARERRFDSIFHEVMSYAPLLVQTHPQLLAQVSRKGFMEELPDDAATRWRQEALERARRRQELDAIPEEQLTQWDRLALDSPELPPDFSHHDFDRLSIGPDHRGYFPASPLREPFHSLLAHEPGEGLSLIRDLTNHATTAWRQFCRRRPRGPTPLPLLLEFPWGRQEFWGEERHYTWFRGHGGPQALESALMALDRWALGQVDAGRSASEVLQQLLEGQSSVAVLGIAVHVALRAQEVSPVTLALLGSQRLWHYDIRRYVREAEFHRASLIGFKPISADKPHRQAVVDAANMTSRQLELRSLVALFVLSGNVQLRADCRALIERFQEAIEFEYEEEARDESRVAELRRTAELWSEFGRAENYEAVPVPGREDVVGIELRNPRHADPDVQEAFQRHAQMSREMALWVWVDKCFESNGWAPGYSPQGAVEHASLLAQALAEGGEEFRQGGISMVHGAIAGTAAAIWCFTEERLYDTWVDATLRAYGEAREPEAEEVFAESQIPWHPKIFVARALGARIQHGVAGSAERQSLYDLIAHPLEVVSLAAIDGVARCLEQDPRYAWCGFNLGLRLAQYQRMPDAYAMTAEARRDAEQIRRRTALAEAWQEYQQEGDLPAWVRPRPAWVREPSATAESDDIDDEGGWHRSNEVWIGQHAAEVLHRIPVSRIVLSEAKDRFFQAIEVLLDWTLDAQNPAWRTQRQGRRDRDATDLYEWEAELGRLLAAIATHMPEREMRERFLTPILEQPDELAMRYCRTFVFALVCSEILDAPTIENRTLAALEAVMDRTLQHRTLRRTPHNDGSSIGFDLPEVIQSFLFVIVERASGATRFANGQWDDLAQVMPLVDKMVRSAGWHSYVARQFVTLCQRAGSAYPIELFADQILVQVAEGRLPAAWKDTDIPALIAELVQIHADRLHPLPAALARKLLHVLDALVDLGDRRSAALQQSESFRGVRL